MDRECDSVVELIHQIAVNSKIATADNVAPNFDRHLFSTLLVMS